MRPLKNLIYSKIVLFIIFIVFTTSPNNISFEIGVYDFTDVVSKEFYKIAPSLYVCFEINKKSKLSFNIVSGLSGTSVKYNEKRHDLFIIPIFLSVYYNFSDSDSKIQPFIGGGFSIQGKLDKNHWIEESHKSVTYGNHMVAGLKLPINKKAIFFGTLRYNVLIPPTYNEDLNTNGIITTIGLKFPLNLKKDNTPSPIRNARGS